YYQTQVRLFFCLKPGLKKQTQINPIDLFGQRLIKRNIKKKNAENRKYIKPTFLNLILNKNPRAV
ncbi:MAG: hypothetical protein J5870_03425, partial [Clostridia bacterium]|nr:hypothetical protein [Clostridia bacterium]